MKSHMYNYVKWKCISNAVRDEGASSAKLVLFFETDWAEMHANETISHDQRIMFLLIEILWRRLKRNQYSFVSNVYIHKKPQATCGKVMFLQLSDTLDTGGLCAEGSLSARVSIWGFVSDTPSPPSLCVRHPTGLHCWLFFFMNVHELFFLVWRRPHVIHIIHRKCKKLSHVNE